MTRIVLITTDKKSVKSYNLSHQCSCQSIVKMKELKMRRNQMKFTLCFLAVRI